MSSSSRPPPGYVPPPSNVRQPGPNPASIAGPMQNLQIGPAPVQPGPNPAAFRSAPPGRPVGSPFVGNGPSIPGISGQRFPPQAPFRGPFQNSVSSQPVPGSLAGSSPFSGPPSVPPPYFSARPSSQHPPPPSFGRPSPAQQLPGPPSFVAQPTAQQMPGPPSFAAPPLAQQLPGPPSFGTPSPAQQLPGPPSFAAPASAQQPPGPPSFAVPASAQQPPFAGYPGRPGIPLAVPSQTAPLPFTGPPPPPSFGGMPRSQPFPAPGPYSRPAVTPPYQGPPSMPGATQAPPRMYGMGPHVPSPGFPSAVGQSPIATTQGSSPSKIDPNQIPRPVPTLSETIFETRQGNQANLPPPASSEYIVRDNGNCSPRLMRCTVNQIPCTSDLISTSSMPLALIVQPLALPHPSEEPIQVVDFGESGPIRCSRCKGYINPFMKFIDQGKRFVCNLCGFTDETPRDYYCNLGPDGRRRDADERPELCKGAVEFVATKEYMVRDPMPPVFFFLIDVSMNAVKAGATAAACSAIGQAIADLPEGPRTMVGVATFDSTIHFYSLKRGSQQPQMLIVPDIQDVYTPLHSDIIVKLTECRQHLGQLLETIPSMFETNQIPQSAFGAATKAAFLALKPTGGKLLVFQSVLPSAGLGSLSAREAEGRANVSSSDKEAHKLLQPMDKSYKTMALEFAEQQVCVDVFITAQSYVDIASISAITTTTGGQVYYYYPFSAISDSAKLYNDLRWNVSRPQGFEAVMRVRCGQGLQVQEYSGNFCKRIPTDIDLPAIDCDKTIMVTFKHDDKFQEGTECAFQCALLYTTIYGERRIRVTTLSLPCTSMLSNLFRSADLDAQFTCMLKQAAMGVPSNSLAQVRDQITNFCINILHSYRKFCATVSSSGQLILPEALKLLPLYTLALTKSVGLRSDGRLDERSYWVNRVASVSAPQAAPLVYPRLFAVHSLGMKDDDESVIPPALPLSSEHISDDGVYLLENGEDALVYVGGSVKSGILDQIFGTPSIDGLSPQFVLEQYDNELSKRLNDAINEIRRQRCSYLRLRLYRKGDPSGMFFFSHMVEDKSSSGLSYVEFLVHVHRQIQTKMA